MSSLEQNESNLETSVRNIHSELIEKCRLNDQKAQMQVYRLYYKAMYNTALRIVNNITEAEDIMQESFLDAFRKIESYREESSFGSWLKKIVINRSLDALKGLKQVFPIEEAQIEPIEDTTDDDDEYMEILTAKVDNIRKGIHCLPDGYRVILSLYLLEGFDHDEIAQILDISNNLSRVRYLRAKRKLTEYLLQTGDLGAVTNNNN